MRGHVIPTSEAPELAHEPLNCRVLCRRVTPSAATALPTTSATPSTQPSKRAGSAGHAFHASQSDSAAQHGRQTPRRVAPSGTASTPWVKARSALHTPRRCV